MNELALAQAEIKRFGDAALATKAEVDELGKSIPELKGRLKAVEQLAAGGMRGVPAGDSLTGTMSGAKRSIGGEIAQSESFKAFIAGNGTRFKTTLARSILESKNTIVDTNNNIAPPDRLLGIIEAPQRNLRVRDLFTVLHTATNVVETSREASFVNNAAPQDGEGATKAESDITFELASWKVQTIAHTIKVSKQSLDDQPALHEFLDRRMEYGVGLAEDIQMLTGDGNNPNLSGILASGNHTDYNRTTAADTKLDELRRAATQLALTDFEATGVVVNPADWEAIVLEKDSESRYLLGPAARGDVASIWGLPVIVSNSLTSGQFIVGDFHAAGAVFDRMQTVVEAFEQDEDNVQRNLVTIRAENRVALAIMRPAAIVVGSFA